MPQRILSPGCAEFVMDFAYGGETCINRYHYFSGVPWSASMLIGMCQFLWDWWDDNVRTSMPATLTLNQVRGTDLSTADGAQGLYVAPSGPITGSFGSPQLPNNVTVAVKWTTETRGRSARGRTFHIGLSEGTVTGNRVNNDHINELLSFYSKLIDDPGIIELTQFCVLSEVSGGAPRALGVTYPITAVSIDPVIDTQRRRLPR